jgi:hypothetical protein
MNIMVFAFVFAITFEMHSAAGQEDSLPPIPDQFLTSAIQRLNQTIKHQNSPDLNAHSYFVMRASNRFEIVYGTERWKTIRPVVTEILQRAEDAATDPVSKEKIKTYSSSLFEVEE